MRQHFNPEDMPEGFLPTEAAVLDQECEDVRCLWTQFVHYQLNTVEGNVHNPPALLASAGNMAFVTIEDIAFPDEDSRQMFLLIVGHFGGTMFRFGQFCSQRGVLAANMEQCRCGSVSDDDLAKLLGDNK